MKLKGISLGMGFGDYWNNTPQVEQNTKVAAEPEIKHSDYIAAFIRLMGNRSA